MATANYKWFIEADLDKYAGKWVAIDEGTVLDSAAQLDELLRKMRNKHPSAKPFITRIRDKLLRLHS